MPLQNKAIKKILNNIADLTSRIEAAEGVGSSIEMPEISLMDLYYDRGNAYTLLAQYYFELAKAPDDEHVQAALTALNNAKSDLFYASTNYKNKEAIKLINDNLSTVMASIDMVNGFDWGSYNFEGALSALDVDQEKTATVKSSISSSISSSSSSSSSSKGKTASLSKASKTKKNKKNTEFSYTELSPWMEEVNKRHKASSELSSHEEITLVDGYEMPSSCIIANTAILANGTAKCFGVYADEGIEQALPLATYSGKEVTWSSKNDGTDRSYFFMLSENKAQETVTGIDARLSRGFEATFNGTIKELANISVENVAGKITFITKRKIEKGEQLLINYGDAYYQNEDTRFIKPRDTWLDSKDYLKLYSNTMDVSKPLDLDGGLQQLMQLTSGKQWQYFSPNVNANTAKGIDNPVLIYKEQEDIKQKKKQGIFYRAKMVLVPQSDSENYSPLMLALWNGEMPKIDLLVKKGASLNYRSSKFGYTPLHILFLTPHIDIHSKILKVKAFLSKNAAIGPCLLPQLLLATSLTIEHKLALLNELNDQKIDFSYKEKDTESSLMQLAIKTGNVYIVKWILKKLKTKVAISELLTETNSDEQCSLLLALASGNSEIINAVIPYMMSKDLNAWSGRGKDSYLQAFKLSIHQLRENESYDDSQKKACCELFIAGIKTLEQKQKPKDINHYHELKALLNYDEAANSGLDEQVEEECVGLIEPVPEYLSLGDDLDTSVAETLLLLNPSNNSSSSSSSSSSLNLGFGSGTSLSFFELSSPVESGIDEEEHEVDEAYMSQQGKRARHR